MRKPKPVPSFPVESLPIAAALMAAGLSVHSIDRTNPRRAIFNFSDSRAADLAGQYIRGDLRIDPKVLFARFDDLRSLIRQGDAGR